MDCSCEYATVSWGYGVILIFHDWILCLIYLVAGKWENYPKFRQKFDSALIRRRQTAQCMKTGNDLLKRIIALHFGEKYAGLPLPILRNRGGLLWG